MNAYARRTRGDLTGLIGRVDAYDVQGHGGVSYQVEVSAHWDAGPGEMIRVIGSIDDGGFRSGLRPVMDGFLVDGAGMVAMADLDTTA